MIVKVGQRWMYKGGYSFIIEVVSIFGATIKGKIIAKIDSCYNINTHSTWSLQELDDDSKYGWHYLKGQDKP
jgi:hypothetical protein